jgi:hypothetical protein
LTKAGGSRGGGQDGEETRRVGRLFGPDPLNISELNIILSKETSIDLIKDVIPLLKKFQIKYEIIRN